MNKKKIVKGLGIAFTFLLTGNVAFANLSVRDSIGVENQNGKKVILHKLQPKESYYSLGRKYNIPTKQLIDFNANKALKAGDVVKVPTGLAFTQTVKATQPRPSVSGGTTLSSQSTDFIEYKVGAKETLFAISKRFGLSVDVIKTANNMTDNALKAGQIIKIPNTAVEEAANDPNLNNTVISNDELNSVSTETGVSVEENGTIDAEEPKEEDSPANRYGIKQNTANGIGIWMDDLNGQSGKMLALHNAAPVGTVIKITNPMTNRTTYAKVVGKFNETSENKDAIIVISKSVASLIGVIDRRFQVNISY